MKKLLGSIFLLSLIGFSAWNCSDENSSSADENSSSADEKVPSFSLGNSSETAFLKTAIKEDGPDMLNYGQLNAVVSADSLLSIFDYGDIVTVIVADKDTFDAPVVSSWNDVSSGEYLVMAVEGKNFITMGKNYGQTGVDFGIAQASDGKTETLFVLRDDVDLPIKVSITMKNKGGYIDNLKMREKQNQGKKRENYPELTDDEYANFRAISTPGMGKNVLYRSSSPIDPSLGRNTYADSLAGVAKIAVFMNLTDNKNGAVNYDGFDDSYYSKQKIAFLGLPAAFTSSLFKEGLVKGLRYMIENEGPYLVHCREGKDRAGYVSAILEALMGASIEDIKKDYSKTYTNYYNVVDGKQEQLTSEDVAWFEKIIVLNMKLGFAAEGIKNMNLEDGKLSASQNEVSPLLGVGVANSDSTNDEAKWIGEIKNLQTSSTNSEEELEVIDDLQAATEKYLISLGLTETEVKSLQERLK